MKALSLIQPWATLVALGKKQFETRSWSTTYRGPLAIHASKGFPGYARAFAECERTFGRLAVDLPLGAIVARARLVAVRRTEEVSPTASELELQYGDFSPRRYAWELADVVALDEPIPARGALGLWEWSG